MTAVFNFSIDPRWSYTHLSPLYAHRVSESRTPCSRGLHLALRRFKKSKQTSAVATGQPVNLSIPTHAGAALQGDEEVRRGFDICSTTRELDVVTSCRHEKGQSDGMPSRSTTSARA